MTQPEFNLLDFLPSQEEIDKLHMYAKIVYDSGLIPPNLKTQDASKKEIISKIMTIFLKGYELHLKPMQALAEIGIIRGKPVISAKLMLSLIFRHVPTAEIIFDKIEKEKCIVRARRDKSQEFTTFSFTKDDAKKAELWDSKSFSWQKYKSQMLKWRAVSNMARTVFPDIIMGSYLLGEIEEGDDSNTFHMMNQNSLNKDEILSESNNLIKEEDQLDLDKDITIKGDDKPNLTPKKILELAKGKNEDHEIKKIMDMKLELDLDGEGEKESETETETSPTEPEEKKNRIQLKTFSLIKKKPKKEEKPTISSTLDKIKNISSKPDPKPKEVKPPIQTSKKKEKKTIPGLNLSFNPKKSKKESQQESSPKKLSVEVTKQFMNPDFYYSSTQSDDIEQDLPWNYLKEIISEDVNTDSKNVFNAEVGKYFRNFAKDSPSSMTISEILVDAYEQYCEIDLQETPINIMEIFHEKMNILINNLKQILRTNKLPMEVPSFIEKTGVDPQFSKWVLGFLESRELIHLEGNLVQKPY